MTLTRRQLLVGSAVAVATARPIDALGACRAPCHPLIPSATAQAFFDLMADLPVVDSHGHIFNATDMPAFEWLRDVEIASQTESLGGAVLGLINANLYNDLERMILAPTAATERDMLDLLLKDRPLRAVVMKDGQPTRNFHGQIIRVAMNNATPVNASFVKSLSRHSKIGVAHDKLLKGDKTAISVLGSRYAVMMNRTVSHTCPTGVGPQMLEKLQAFAEPMSRTRLHNFLTWRKTYGLRVGSERSIRPVRLFTPAIVDVDHWLRNHRNGKATHPSNPLYEQRSPIADQVDVLSRISLLFPGTVVPFIGFDPWREVAEGTALQTVKDAILNKGFVGVKLYPAIGFRPIGNAELDDLPPSARAFPSYADVDGLGKKLDDALIGLYRFCIEHDVPIMAHCANSNGAFKTVAEGREVWVSERAHPRYWKDVLTGAHGGGAAGEFKNLRLSLAHLAFGEPEWAQAIGELMAAHPNVYADTSYFGEALQDGQNACVAARDLAQRAGSFLGAKATTYPLGRKIMYGSDWFMTATEAPSASYLNTVARLYYDKVAGPLSEGDQGRQVALTRAFLSGNALRFFGLESKDRQAHKRLTAFYAATAALNAEEKRAAAQALERFVEVAA